MLRLLINRDVQGATIPLDWCITRECYQELAKRKAFNPHLLILIRPSGSDDYAERRYLVPLTNFREYVVMNRPGVTNIFATIVWNAEGNANTLRDRYLKRDCGRFDTDLLRSDESGFIEEKLCNQHNDYLAATSAEVVVPQNLFAKPLPRRLAWWINLGFSQKKHRDECQVRGRMIYAFTLKPLLVFIAIMWLFLVRLFCTVIHLLALSRDLDFEPLIHPFRYKTKDIWWESNRFGLTWSVSKKLPETAIVVKGEESTPIYAFVLLTPLFPVATASALLAYAYASHYRHPILWTLKWDVIAFGSITLALFTTNLFDWLGEAPLFQMWKNRKMRKRNAALEGELEIREALVCDSLEFKQRFVALPVRQRIHLFFWGKKSDVCKPYPQ